MAEVPKKKARANERTTPATDSLAVTWEADRFVLYQHNSQWHISVILIGIAAVLLIFLLRRELQVSPYLAIPVIVLGVGVLIGRSLIRPSRATYGITEDGILIDHRTIPFSVFRSFAVIVLEDHNVLRLWPVQKLGLPQSIIIEQIDPAEVREIVGTILPEEEKDQSISDQISHILHF